MKKIFICIFLFCVFIVGYAMASTDFLHDDEIEFGTPKKTVYDIEEARGNGLEDHMYAWNRNELIYEIDAALGPVDCTYKRYYFDPDTSELYQVSYYSSGYLVGGKSNYDLIKDYFINEYGNPLYEDTNRHSDNQTWSAIFEGSDKNLLINDSHWLLNDGEKLIGIDLFLSAPTEIYVIIYDTTNVLSYEVVASVSSEKDSLNDTSDSSQSNGIEYFDTASLYEYEIMEDGTAEITKYKGFENVVRIPKKIDGYPVTSIGENVFNSNPGIVNVIIHDGVKNIGENAFRVCMYLEKITIPDSVESIGNYAFSHCAELKEVILSKNIKELSEGIFAECAKLEKVEIPDGVINIGSSAFSSCSSLNDIIIPDSVVAIGDKGFYQCEEFQEITLPESVKYIGNNAFTRCKKLRTIEVQGELIKIGNEAFEFCEELHEIVLPSSVESIGGKAFSHCTSLESITIPDKVTKIMDGTFDYCSGITSISLPVNLLSIGKNAFAHCEKLESIILPESVEEIGKNVFRGCKLLNKIYITPNSFAENYCIENGLPCSNIE